MPEGLSFTGKASPAADGCFLADTSWADADGNRHNEQQIFDAAFETNPVVRRGHFSRGSLSSIASSETSLFFAPGLISHARGHGDGLDDALLVREESTEASLCGPGFDRVEGRDDETLHALCSAIHSAAAKSAPRCMPCGAASS